MEQSNETKSSERVPVRSVRNSVGTDLTEKVHARFVRRIEVDLPYDGVKLFDFNNYLISKGCFAHCENAGQSTMSLSLYTLETELSVDQLAAYVFGQEHIQSPVLSDLDTDQS